MFKAVLGIDAVVTTPLKPDSIGGPLASYKRRDIWPSRETAAESLGKNKFYNAWSKGSFDNYIEYGLRNLPTRKYPLNGNTDKKGTKLTEESVTLTCPVPQELATFQNIPPELKSGTPMQLMDPYECLLAIKNTKVPTRLILTDIGRLSYMLYDEHYRNNPNITYSWMDKKETHCAPMENPEAVADEMANFFSKETIKALEKEKEHDSLERYDGFHPAHHETFGKMLEENKAKAKI